MIDNLTPAASAPAALNGKAKITTKDPALKLALKRLTVLQLAESLGNVSEACRRGGLDRTSFYEYKRRFQTHGIEGLKDLPPIHKTHPQTTPPEVVAEVLALSLANPTRWLCVAQRQAQVGRCQRQFADRATHPDQKRHGQTLRAPAQAGRAGRVRGAGARLRSDPVANRWCV